MNRAPVDGSDREGRSVEERSRGVESASIAGRVATTLRSVGQSLRDGLRSLAGRQPAAQERETVERTRRPARDDRAKSVQCVGLTEEVLEGDGRAVTDGLVRAQAAERTNRQGPEDDRPELVVRWSDDELTLTAPDRPNAHITSTHWEEVKR